MRTAYKVLENGQSFNGGQLKWSLPKGETPGDWHEVDGELKHCRNGLHLTTAPKYRAPSKPSRFKAVQCFLAEYGDEFLEAESDEIVARRVRLVRHVPWEEIDESLKTSPAMQLLSLVWDSEGETSGQGPSWRRLNSSMQEALRLAIDSGMHFAEDDFGKIQKLFRPEYWLHIEGCYSRAIDAPHGPNPSAYQAIEKHLGRKPFIVQETSSTAKKVRLNVGSKFKWHEDMLRAIDVKVTSFGSIEKGEGGAKQSTQCVIACSYKERDRSKYEPDKVDRIFKITHEDIAAYHKAIREHKKAKAS